MQAAPHNPRKALSWGQVSRQTSSGAKTPRTFVRGASMLSWPRRVRVRRREEIGIIFRTDMRRAKNTSRGADFVGANSISFASTRWVKAHSFRCSSSSKLKRCFNFEKDGLPESSSIFARGDPPRSGGRAFLWLAALRVFRQIRTQRSAIPSNRSAASIRNEIYLL